MTKQQNSYKKKSNLVSQGYWIRAIAFAIDLIIFMAIAVISIIIMIILFGGDAVDRIGGNISLWILLIIHFTLPEGMFGATPGKLIMKLRVVKEDGSPCDLKAAAIRGAARILDGGLFLTLVAFFRMRRNPLSQRFGDSLAKTVVVGSSSPVVEVQPISKMFGAMGISFVLGLLIYVADILI